MNEPAIRSFPDRATMAGTLADELAGEIVRAVATRGRAGLVVSGGTTPEPLFRALAVRDLPWGSVVVTLADERLVPSDHPASNEALVRRTLLSGPASAARFIALDDGMLAGFPWPADLVLLGMGEDGHTASLFPGAEGLTAALDPANPARVVPVVPRPLPSAAPFPRRSLTLAALLDSRRILLLLAGADKLDTLAAARAPGEVAAMPIRAILRQTRVKLDICHAP